MTDESFEILPQPPRRRGGRLLVSLSAAVVLAAGGAATYVAFASADPGSDSPSAAVQKVVADLQHGDLLGVVDDLAPGERDALRGAVTDDVASLKRLGVLKQNADPSAVTGVTFAAHDLTYASPVKVTDAVSIVPITKGSFDISGDLAKFPVTARILDLAKGSERSSAEHHDIGADPLRIAAQQVGGRWYASLFYTVADQAADHRIPSASDHIPAKGAGSGEAADRTMLTDLIGGNPRGALELVSPAELGAVHDYAGAALDGLSMGKLSVRLTTLDLSSTDVDGGKKITVSKAAMSFRGQQVSVERANGCLKIASAFLTKTLCAGDIAETIGGFVSAFTCSSGFSYGAAAGSSPYSSSLHITRTPGSSMHGGSARGGVMFGAGCKGPTFTAAQKQAIGDLFSALLDAGVITTPVDGAWYVAPVRTIAELTSSTLSSLKGDDLFQLATLGR